MSVFTSPDQASFGVSSMVSDAERFIKVSQRLPEASQLPSSDTPVRQRWGIVRAQLECAIIRVKGPLWSTQTMLRRSQTVPGRRILAVQRDGGLGVCQSVF